jgi:hypothetical protein
MEIGDFQVREVAPRTTVTNFKWLDYLMVTGAAFHDIESGVYVLRKRKRTKMLEQEMKLRSTKN